MYAEDTFVYSSHSVVQYSAANMRTYIICIDTEGPDGTYKLQIGILNRFCIGDLEHTYKKWLTSRKNCCTNKINGQDNLKLAGYLAVLLDLPTCWSAVHKICIKFICTVVLTNNMIKITQNCSVIAGSWLTEHSNYI